MFKLAKPLSIIVETLLHAGSGSDLGIVDLPIQRERHTQYPKIEVSSLKGCLREAFKGQHTHEAFKEVEKDYKQRYIYPVFGPEDGDEFASALGVTDARLLLFPVKSMKGVFAWITCPAVLNRFQQDLKIAKQPAPQVDCDALANTTPNGAALFVKDDKVVLEEYTFTIEKNEQCGALAAWLAENMLPQGEDVAFWRNKMTKDLIVLSNDDFCDFVTMSTEVIARTKINDDTGTVQQGALWYEEYLPADSVLYTLVLASDPFTKQGNPQDAKAVMDFFADGLGRASHILQLGGNATIGKGLVRMQLMDFTEQEG